MNTLLAQSKSGAVGPIGVDLRDDQLNKFSAEQRENLRLLQEAAEARDDAVEREQRAMDEKNNKR